MIINSKSTIRKAPPKVVKTVYVDTVSNSTIPIIIPANGNLIAKRRVEIYSEVQGIFKPASKLFKQGEKYKKNEIFITINNTEYYSSVQSAKSNLYNSIVAIMADLRLDFPDIYPKWQDYIKSFDLDKTTPKLPKMSSEKENYFITGRGIVSNYYSVKNLEERLTKYTIKAPFKGRVRQKMVDIGMVVSPGLAIAQIYATDYVEISLPIAEQDLVFLGIPLDGSTIDKKSQPYVKLFTEFGGEVLSWEGTIVRSSAEIDSRTRMLSVIAQVSDPYQQTLNTLPLKVGIFVKASINGLSYNDIVKIPRYTVRENKVWVVSKEGILDQKQIQILRYEEDYALVSGGLEISDSVLLTRLSVLVKGMKLKQN